MKKTTSTFYVAGSSGGHIIPCLTMAQHKKNKDSSIIFFTTDKPLDRKLLEQEQGIDRHITLPVGGLTSKNPLKVISLAFTLLIAFIKSIYYCVRYRPTSVTTTGGSIAIPVCLAAKLMRIPIYLYELNVIPGRTTKFLSSVATNVYTCFTQTKQYLPKTTCTQTAYPIRFFNEPEQHSKSAACKLLNFTESKTTLLIIGGSQGSLFLNDAIKKWVENNPQITASVQIIHQTGAQDTFDWLSFYSQHAIPALVFDYKHEMELMYAAADLIVCRSGAGTLFEVLFFNKPCLTIPLETKTTDHQKLNAYTMEQEYPEIFTVIRQQTIETSPSVFYFALSRHLKTPAKAPIAPVSTTDETAQI